MPFVALLDSSLLAMIAVYRHRTAQAINGG